MREFSVLIRAAEDLPECWVAHCLNWDLVSQGSSPSDAAKSVAEAIVLAIAEDTAAGVAAVMYSAQVGARSAKADSNLRAVPPPFMITAMPHDNSPARLS